MARLVRPANERPEDFDALLNQVLEIPATENDTLCCGILGRTELLLEASIRLERPDLLLAAKSLQETLLSLRPRDSRNCLLTRVVVDKVRLKTRLA